MATCLNLVVVEDNDSLRQVTVEVLRLHGHHALGCSCAEDIDDIPKTIPTDIFILDLNLPGEDGLSLAARLRRSYPKVGIIMVTARSQTSDKTRGYDIGADIYLCKPVSQEELLSAIQALGRRVRSTNESEIDLTLDMNKLVLFNKAGAIQLTANEAELLAAFIRAHEQRVENWQLIALLSNDDNFSKENLEVHIARLRNKLKKLTNEPQTIKAIRNFGYQFCLQAKLN